jgi:hypothetical protein
MDLLVSIDELKAHLKIELGYMEEDSYLDSLLHVAQESVERSINRPLCDEESDGVRHCIRIFAANLYANRESVSFGSPQKIPHSLECLIGMHKNYGSGGIVE